MLLAASVSVSGVHGVLYLLAALCFLIGCICALALGQAARWWPVLLLLGLFFLALTGIFHG